MKSVGMASIDSFAGTRGTRCCRQHSQRRTDCLGCNDGPESSEAMSEFLRAPSGFIVGGSIDVLHGLRQSDLRPGAVDCPKTRTIGRTMLWCERELSETTIFTCLLLACRSQCTARSQDLPQRLSAFYHNPRDHLSRQTCRFRRFRRYDCQTSLWWI